MGKIKLLHLITSLKTGGAETVLVDLLRNIDKDVFDNEVIFFYEGPNVEKIKEIGINVYQIKGLFFRYDPMCIFRLFLLIKKIKPDLIHSSLWSANLLGTAIAKFLNIPVICALHLANNSEASGKNNKFRNLLDNLILSKSNRLIAISDSIISSLEKNHWFNNQKLRIIKNGIDINNINLLAKKSILKKEDFGIDKESFVIGTVGRFVPRKNQKMLIEAFAKLSKEFDNTHLVLIGYGQTEILLKTQINQLDIKNKATFIKTSNACEYYRLFDCFALTSVNEGLPIVLLEAMLFSLPSIVTNSNIKHEVISDNINGYVIKNNDIQDLYLKLKNLYLNVHLREELGKKAKETIYENFNVNKMTEQYQEEFSDLYSKRV